MFFTQLHSQFCCEKLMLPFAAEITGISILEYQKELIKRKMAYIAI